MEQHNNYKEAFEELKRNLRFPREEELRALGQRPMPGLGLRETFEQLDRLAIIADVDVGAPDALEQTRRYLNAGCDAILLSESSADSLSTLWNIEDFLKTRENPPPTIRNYPLLHPQQVLTTAETGTRSIVLPSMGVPLKALDGLYHAANLARLDCIFSINSEKALETILPLTPQIVGIDLESLDEYLELLPKVSEVIFTLCLLPIESEEDAWTLYNAGCDAIIIEEPEMDEQALQHWVDSIRNLLV